MTQDQIRFIALYFHLFLIEPALSDLAVQESVQILKKELEKKSSQSEDLLILKVIIRIWKKYEKKRTGKNAQLTLGGRSWIVPANLNLDHWLDFQKSVSVEEIQVLVLHQVLGVSINECAQVLRLSDGTIQYRLHRALRRLGGFFVSHELPEVNTESTDKDQQGKPFRKRMSEFLGFQMIPEYTYSELDTLRSNHVKSLLQSSEPARNELARIRKSEDYCAQLSEITFPNEKFETWLAMPSTTDRIGHFLEMKGWPMWVRLSVESIIVAVGVLTIATIIPWVSVFQWLSKSQPVVLTEIARQSETEVESQTADITPTTAPVADFQDEVAAKPKIPTTTVPVAKVAATTATKPETKVVSRKILFRGRSQVVNLDVVNQRLVQGLEKIGGRKAGQVELGWRKGKGSYFHFTLPESRYDDMVTLFKGSGDFVINKENHDREMPEGIIRIIIDVEDKNPTGK